MLPAHNPVRCSGCDSRVRTIPSPRPFMIGLIKQELKRLQKVKCFTPNLHAQWQQEENDRALRLWATKEERRELRPDNTPKERQARRRLYSTRYEWQAVAVLQNVSDGNRERFLSEGHRGWPHKNITISTGLFSRQVCISFLVRLL